MAGTRDDFTPRTKSDLALRASHHCSLCKCSTVGPSEEASNAVTNIGVAAHICAAAPGQGARRYDATMTPEERSHIENGIWLCASCSVLIDRDEGRFTVENLRNIKRDHERSRQIGPADPINEGDIIAIGPNLIAVGRVVRSDAEGIRARIIHFVNGSERELWSLTQEFDKWPAERRYVLFNELGFGGLLAEPPSVERADASYTVHFRLGEPATRRNAADPIRTMDRENGRMIEGLDAYVQKFEATLGMAQGTWFARIKSGSDISDLYWRYKESSWFGRLAMTEMIRLSSIPSPHADGRGPSTPFAIVNRVDQVEIPTFDLDNQHLLIRVQFDLEGLGFWERTLSVFISTQEQLEESRKRARTMSDFIRDPENVGLVEVEALLSPKKSNKH